MPKRVEIPKHPPTVGDELKRMNHDRTHQQIEKKFGRVAADQASIDRLMKPKKGGMPQGGKRP